MTEPKRIQRKRSKGWKMPKNTVYVGRPTYWGNRFKIGETYDNDGTLIQVESARHAIQLFKLFQMQDFDLDKLVKELRGKNLACFCPLNQPCHADILLVLANK